MASFLISGAQPNPLTEERKKKIGPTGKLTSQELSLLQFVGTATPGTGKGARAIDALATSTLSQPGRFADIPSSGGFTVLGKNALGQDIARDNATGQVRPVSAFGSISPEARAIGETGTPREISAKNNQRRPRTERTPDILAPKKKNVLGTQGVLGAQSILG